MTLTVEQVVGTYIKLRRKKEALENQVKADVDAIKASMGKIEAWLMEKADADGVTSFKTTAGTAFVTTTDFANVADWDAVLTFIKSNDAFDMLEKRVSKSAVRAYMDESGDVPPGINYGTKIGINVRKAAGGDE
jgi:Ethanolamine utilization protein EutJ (predicted chaperonin)